MTKFIKHIFTPPKITKGNPSLRMSFTEDEHTYRHNEVELSRASFEVQKEALQKTLMLTYASFLVSILATLTATGALIVAIINRSS